MANALATNPWVLDTADPAVLYATDVRAAHFEWSNYTAQTDQVIIKDRFGKVIWSVTGKDDISMVESFTIEWVHGIVLDTLTAGVVRVYFK